MNVMRYLRAAVVAVLAAVLLVGCSSAPPAPRSITLTFIRHAESEANAAGVAATTVPGPPLKPAGKGLVLGTFFSIINFIVMAEMIPFRLGKTGKSAFFLSLFSILFRYIFLAVPLLLAIRLEQIDLIGVVFGIFMFLITLA